MKKPTWQQEFDALPKWAQNIVIGLRGIGSCGGMDDRQIKAGMRNAHVYEGFHVLLNKASRDHWWNGFFEACDLASAMSAPGPRSQMIEPPTQQMSLKLSLVLMIVYGISHVTTGTVLRRTQFIVTTHAGRTTRESVVATVTTSSMRNVPAFTQTAHRSTPNHQRPVTS